jgi:hypothetical protein
MRTLVVSALAIVLLTGAAATGRQSDPDLNRLIEQYQTAWNKGDAKTLGALYSQNAMRTQTNGAPLAGRAAIEQFFAKNFAADSGSQPGDPHPGGNVRGLGRDGRTPAK